MIINGKEYEILKVYEQKHRSKDVILCKHVQSGLKECFHRCDIEKMTNEDMSRERRELTDKDIEFIREEIMKGSTNERICSAIPDVRIYHILKVIRAEREKLGVDFIIDGNGRKVGINRVVRHRKPVNQYTLNLTFIKKFDSLHDAEEATRVSATNIKRCCEGYYKQSGRLYLALCGGG